MQHQNGNEIKKSVKQKEIEKLKIGTVSILENQCLLEKEFTENEK